MVVDLDRDGHPDLVVADFAANVVVLHGGPGGAFQMLAPVAATPSPIALAAGDLDGDGWPDIAVADLMANRVVVLVNAGGSWLRPGGGFSVGVNPASLAIGDLDGDGKPDIVVANGSSNDVSVVRNTTQ